MLLIILLFSFGLFIIITKLNSARINVVMMMSLIRFYVLYFLFVLNFFMCFSLFTKSTFTFHFFIFTFSSFSLSISAIVILISSIVILNSINYLSIIDSYLFLFYIILFQISMVSFVLCNNLLVTFLFWDLLGLISYLLINFWSSKVNCGIKAVLYNKVGDNGFLFLIVLFYSILNTSNYSIIFPFAFFIPLDYFSFNSHALFLLLLFVIIYSKSAQLPFSSWLLNAMAAPTPISALLHSSTMVIAGVIIGIVFNDLLFVCFDECSFIFLFVFMIPLITLLWSVFKAIYINDIKSIIALSTVSQLSYMFIALYVNPALCFYHIIVHSLFKSILFLLAGSIIHCQNNYQNIYNIKIINKFHWIIFLLASSILILSLSKELIIHDLFVMLCSPFSFIVVIIGALFTICYSVKIYMYCFWINSMFTFSRPFFFSSISIFKFPRSFSLPSS